MKQTGSEAEPLAEDVGAFISFDGQEVTSVLGSLRRKPSGPEFPQLVSLIRFRSVDCGSIQKRRHLVQLLDRKVLR